MYQGVPPTRPPATERTDSERRAIEAVIAGRPHGRARLPAADERTDVIAGSVVRDLVLGRYGATAAPVVQLNGVTIQGDVDLSYCDWRGKLDLSFCRILGEVTLAYASIQGNVLLRHVSMTRLNITYATIEGPLRATGARCTDGIYGLAARISGSLHLSGARIWAPPAFENRCAVELFRAHLGDLFLNRARLHGGLFANGMEVDRNVRLFGASVVSRSAYGLETGVDSEAGAVSLVGATIGGSLYLSSKRAGEPPLRTDGAILLTRTSCANLRVRVAELRDNDLDVDHFEYGQLVAGRPTPDEWLALLGRTPRVGSQPYAKLARYCGEIGRTDLQRQVQIAWQRRMTSELPRRSAERLRRSLWSRSIAYGYRPRRAILWLGLCVVLSWCVLLVGGDFLVSSDAAASSADRPSALDSAALALDHVLPFAGLGVARAWHADPGDLVQGVWMTVFVGLKLAGWALAALALASVTGILKRP